MYEVIGYFCFMKIDGCWWFIILFGYKFYFNGLCDINLYVWNYVIVFNVKDNVI